MDNIIKNNAKLYIVMLIIILFGSVGVTFALRFGKMTIGIETTAAEIDASITYDTNSNGASIVSSGDLLPISDSKVTKDTTDSRVLKAKFKVTGVNSNPENTIYDIALHIDNIDCDLRNSMVKWRLYKNNNSTPLSEGTMSPTFDTMKNNRLVLTNTQESLTSSTDEYLFLLWISESCTGDIDECDVSLSQNKYLNKKLKGSIKLELSTGSTKAISRTTGSESSCSYTSVSVPSCKSVTYNGSSQSLINTNTNSNYTILNNSNSGINAGSYAVTLQLKDGYKWSDGSTDNRVVNCSINKKAVTVTTLDQEVDYLEDIVNNASYVTTSGLVSGHSVEWVTFSTDKSTIEDTSIIVNNVKFIDSSGNDVTYNYNVIKDNSGIVKYMYEVGTFYYFDGYAVDSVTSICNIESGNTTCNFDLPSEITSSTGPNGSSYYGVSSTLNSGTITTTYNSINNNYYAVYSDTLVVNYTKYDDKILSIGKTIDSCDIQKIYNGTSYTGVPCNVTLPDITTVSGYIGGWFDTSGNRIGNPLSSTSITDNVTIIAKTLTSSDFSYDNSKTEVECTDVTCMLDYLYEGLN